MDETFRSYKRINDTIVHFTSCWGVKYLNMIQMFPLPVHMGVDKKDAITTSLWRKHLDHTKAYMSSCWTSKGGGGGGESPPFTPLKGEILKSPKLLHIFII